MKGTWKMCWQRKFNVYLCMNTCTNYIYIDAPNYRDNIAIIRYNRVSLSTRRYQYFVAYRDILSLSRQPYIRTVIGHVTQSGRGASFHPAIRDQSQLVSASDSRPQSIHPNHSIISHTYLQTWTKIHTRTNDSSHHQSFWARILLLINIAWLVRLSHLM